MIVIVPISRDHSLVRGHRPSYDILLSVQGQKRRLVYSLNRLNPSDPHIKDAKILWSLDRPERDGR